MISHLLELFSHGAGTQPLDRIPLRLRPTGTYAGDPEQCRMMDDSPDDPGVSNAWDSSDARGAFGGGGPAAAPKCFCWASGRSAFRL